MDRWSETTSTKQSSNNHQDWISYFETKGTYRNPAKHRDVSLENKSVIKSLQDYITVRTVDDRITFNCSATVFKLQKNTAFSANVMVRVLGDIYKSAGFKDTSSHSGRRSLITKLAYTGIDLNSIRQIAGPF